MQLILSIFAGIIIGIIPFKPEYFKLIKNKKVEKIVFEIINFIKGLLLVVILKPLFNYEFSYILIGLITSLVVNSFFQGFKFKLYEGHFLTFGGLLVVVPTIDLIWLIIGLIAFIYKRNFVFSFISSTFLTGLLSITSSRIINNVYWFTDPTASTNINFQILIGVLFTLTLLSQIKFVRLYFGISKGGENK